MPKPLPNFALLIGKGSKDQSPETDQSPEMDQSSAEDSAVKDLMSALSSKDVAGFKQALQDFLELCYPQLSDEDTESPDDKAQEASASEAY